MIKTNRTSPAVGFRPMPSRPWPRDPLPLGMLSPASAIGPGADPAIPPETIVVSMPPPARVLP